MDQLPEVFIKIYLEESPRDMRRAGFSAQQIQECFGHLAGYRGEDKTYAIWKEKVKDYLNTEQLQCLANMESRMKSLKKAFHCKVLRNRVGEHSYLRREMCWVISDAIALATTMPENDLHPNEIHFDRDGTPDVEVASAQFQSAYQEAAESLHLEKDSRVLAETLIATVKFVTGSDAGNGSLVTALTKANEVLQSSSFERREDNGEWCENLR